jgi:hypothetical protein
MRSSCPTGIGLGGVDKSEICDAVGGGGRVLLRLFARWISRSRKISLLHENAGWVGLLECWGIPRDCSAREDTRLNRSCDVAIAQES